MKKKSVNNKKISTKYVIALILCSIVYVILFNTLGNQSFSLLLSTYISLIILLSLNYKKHVLLLSYLISFFVFLIGRPFAIEVFSHQRTTAFSLTAETRNTIYMILTISLFSIIIGYAIANIIKKKSGNNDNSNDENNTEKLYENKNEIVKKITSISTIILLLLVIIENIFRLIMIKNVGYSTSYTLEQSYRLPYGLHNLVMMAPISISIYLATLPNRKEVRLPILLFILANIISSMAGNRFEIVSCILSIIVYGVWRNYLENNGWIKLKHILLFIVAIPFVIYAMQGMVYWRDNINYKKNNGIVSDFFYGSGGSSDLIGIVEQSANRILNKGTLYSFGGVWRHINTNIINRATGNESSYESLTIDYAKNAHSLGDTLSYYYYPRQYLNGYGLGNCYIAELYYDFNYIGVIVGNILLGFVIGKMNYIKKYRLIHNTICIIIIISLLRLPRDSFDYPILQIINLKNMLFATIVYFIYKSSLKNMSRNNVRTRK